jgi:voltage-gated potassium channel Kch
MGFESLSYSALVNEFWVFLEYLRGICRYVRFFLILVVNFYYDIIKLIILVPDPY